MTSLRQIEANRRNAQKSTGPTTREGKDHSRRNAVRHGLTAETVISRLEDAEDYKAFEANVIADYDAQSAVERELVLRLASLLWRLRRTTTIETGLFELQADHLDAFRQAQHTPAAPGDMTKAMLERRGPEQLQHVFGPANLIVASIGTLSTAVDPTVEFGRCYLRMANLPNFALDRLSRYEITLWRQVDQTLVALDALDRRKPQERRGRNRLSRPLATANRTFEQSDRDRAGQHRGGVK
jgi:hypothetical protein